MPVDVTGLDIPDVRIIRPHRIADSRGFFSETYNRQALLEAGIALDFVQDMHSLSASSGVVRGLHFQVPPFAQAKLIRVARGAIFDVVVDLRRSSPTYGRHASAVISAEEWNQILVPVGFAHGFCTLAAGTEVLYKVTHHYSPAHERGLRWNDPALGIRWPVQASEATVSGKDRLLPRFSELESFFE